MVMNARDRDELQHRIAKIDDVSSGRFAAHNFHSHGQIGLLYQAEDHGLIKIFDQRVHDVLNGGGRVSVKMSMSARRKVCERETEVLSHLSKHPMDEFDAPQLLDRGELERGTDVYPFYKMTQLDGNGADVHDILQISQSAPEDSASKIQAIGRLMSSFHHNVRALDTAILAPRMFGLQDKLDECLDHYSHDISMKARDMILDAREHVASDIVHGDFMPRNMMFNGLAVTGLFDFGNVSTATPTSPFDDFRMLLNSLCIIEDGYEAFNRLQGKPEDTLSIRLMMQELVMGYAQNSIKASRAQALADGVFASYIVNMRDSETILTEIVAPKMGPQ